MYLFFLFEKCFNKNNWFFGDCESKEIYVEEKPEKWKKYITFLLFKIKVMGIWGLMGIEEEDNAWCQRNIVEKFSSMDDINKFPLKVKE